MCVFRRRLALRANVRPSTNVTSGCSCPLSILPRSGCVWICRIGGACRYESLTVATRRGELAIAQTRLVIAALKAAHPELDIRIREITTAGDKDRHTALWDLKDTGFFTSQLEDALLAGEADLAVHSFKDLPTQEREGLAVTAICNRQWPEDCLLAKQPVGSMDDLPRVGEGRDVEPAAGGPIAASAAGPGTGAAARQRPDADPQAANHGPRRDHPRPGGLGAAGSGRGDLRRFRPEAIHSRPGPGCSGDPDPKRRSSRPWRSCGPSTMNRPGPWSWRSGRSSSRCSAAATPRWGPTPSGGATRWRFTPSSPMSRAATSSSKQVEGPVSQAVSIGRASRLGVARRRRPGDSS